MADNVNVISKVKLPDGNIYNVKDKNASTTDENVKQVPTTANSDFPLLLKTDKNTSTTVTSDAKYNAKGTFNPSTGELKVTKISGDGSGLTGLSTGTKVVTQTSEPSSKTTGDIWYEILTESNNS